MKKNKFYILPNLFTAASLTCGMAAIASAASGSLTQACWLIVLGAVFDGLDGTMARITHTQSEFGGQFDSISDMIVFGAAPAILFYTIFSPVNEAAAILIMASFALAAAVRLARYNLQSKKSETPQYFFQGLPSPGAAIGLVSVCMVYLVHDNGTILRLMPYAALLFAALMVSKVPYVSSKFFLQRRLWTLEFGMFLLIYTWMLASLKEFRPLILLGGTTLYISIGLIQLMLSYPHHHEEHDVEDVELEDFEEHI